MAIPLEKTFREWERIVRNAGIRNIDGHIIGDGRWLDGMPEEPTWQWNDIGTYYGTGVSGLNFYENMISFNVSVNHEGGKEPLYIRQIYPSTSWMDITCSGTVGEKSTGDRLYLERAVVPEVFATDTHFKQTAVAVRALIGYHSLCLVGQFQPQGARGTSFGSASAELQQCRLCCAHKPRQMEYILQQ